MDKFVNGFDCWHAVHFEMAKLIDLEQYGSQAYFRFLVKGREGVYALAREMTDRFELEHKGEPLGTDLARYAQLFCIKHKI